VNKTPVPKYAIGTVTMTVDDTESALPSGTFYWLENIVRANVIALNLNGN
jgi:hypothetical protein